MEDHIDQKGQSSLSDQLSRFRVSFGKIPACGGKSLSLNVSVELELSWYLEAFTGVGRLGPRNVHLRLLRGFLK